MPATNRRLATDFLTKDQLERLRQRSDLKGISLFVHAWIVIFVSMALFVWLPNPVTFILALFVIGSRQLGLSILMHDAAHGALMENQKWNFRVSNWFCAYPLFVDTLAYRKYHLKHHANTQQDNDPDLVLSAPFPTTRKSMIRKVLRDLTGQTGVKQRFVQIRMAFGSSDQTFLKRLKNAKAQLGGPVLVNLILIAGLAATGHWYLYPLLWLLPLLTTYQLVLRIRNIAEHAMVPDDNDPFKNARTTKANIFERMFLAPYWVNYHVEHHLLFWVPCYNLPKMHNFLKEQGIDDNLEVKKSYWSVLKMATSRPDSDDQRGKRVHGDGRAYSGIVMSQET